MAFALTALCVGLPSCNKKEDTFVIEDKDKDAPPPGPYRGTREEITFDQRAFWDHVVPNIPENIEQEANRGGTFLRGGIMYDLLHSNLTIDE